MKQIKYSKEWFANMCKKEEESDIEYEIKSSCEIVETICRSLGEDTTIIFGNKYVSIAPPSWPADSVENTLYDALKDALKQEE